MKIIVLGGSGMWGHQAFLKLSDHFGSDQVACTLRRSRGEFQNLEIFKNKKIYDQIDFTNFKQAIQALNDFKPEVVINCIGLTPRKFDIKNEKLFFQMNAELPFQLNDWCASNFAKLIHFSTDCVFTGKKGDYTEEDKPDAQDVYGQSKAQGEVKSGTALTYRLSKIGREIEGKTEIVEWFLSQKGKSVKGYSKAIYSGVTTNFMASELIRILENYPKLSGLFQVSGPKISKYELLNQLNQVYRCETHIEEVSEYAVDKSLNCTKYSRVTGFTKQTWLEMITNMKNEERINYGSN